MRKSSWLIGPIASLLVVTGGAIVPPPANVAARAPSAPAVTKRVVVCVQTSTMVLRWAPDSRCNRRGEFTVRWSAEDAPPQMCVDMRTRIMKLADGGACPRGARKVDRLTRGRSATACVDMTTNVLKRPRTGRCLSQNLTVKWLVVRETPILMTPVPLVVPVAGTTTSTAPTEQAATQTTTITTVATTTTSTLITATSTSSTTSSTTTTTTTVSTTSTVEWPSCGLSLDCQYALMVTFDLKNEDLSNIDFSFADLGGVELNGANLTNANFTSADMHSSIWDTGVMVSNTVFRYTNLSGVDFHSINLQSLDFYGANLSSTDMSYVVLDGSDLSQSDISGADFTGASLVGVVFNPGVVTNGAMFISANMYGIDMSNMTLSGAVGFQGANLRNADFRNADLSYANFTNAVLTGADFSGATLTGADFTGATDGPDPSTTSTSSTTSTTVAVTTCAGGGSCVVGDTGPGGGTVVYTAGSGSTTYMEVAPQNWYASTEAAFRWCYPQTNTLAGASGTALGTGRSNTTAMRSLCTSNGAAYWVNYKNTNGGIGGKTDWIIPSKAELNYVCLYARRLSESAGTCTGGTLRSGFVNASYWSSSEFDQNRAWYQNFANGGQAYVDGLKGTSVYVRPVRFFGT